jgi:hypothetical protein
MVPGAEGPKANEQIVMLRIPEKRAGLCPAPFNRFAGILTGIAFLPLLQSPVLAGQSINLMWQPSPDANVVGYAVYEGTNSGAYTSRIDARNTTSVTVSNLASGVNYYFVATAYDSSGLESLPSNEIVQSVKVPVNTAPFISAIANQTITVGGSTGPVPFTIADLETTSSSLVLSSSSSNPQLVPANNIVLGGYLSNRTVTVTGAAGQTGSALISVLVSDGQLSASSLFTVTAVNPPPAIAFTSPVEAAVLTSPAAISLQVTVVANGHSISAVQFFDSGILLGQVESAPFSINASNLLAGNHTLVARLLYDAGSMLDSSPVHIVVTGLPAPWQVADIGVITPAGTVTESQGSYVVRGAGNISGNADNFRFVYQPLSGDGEIKVRINSMENTGANGRIGVVIRESLSKGSKYAFIGTSPDGNFRWQYRNSTGGKTASTLSSSGAPPNIWTRLARAGNTLAGYKSIDGTNWSLVSSRNLSMATNIYVGLAVASGSSNTLNTATFTNVFVVP